MKDAIRSELLVIDAVEAGLLPQPFEHQHKENVIVFSNRVELRQMEGDPSRRKYVVHTENFLGDRTRSLDPNKFLDTFKRSYKTNNDTRAAIRMALKVAYVQP